MRRLAGSVAISIALLSVMSAFRRTQLTSAFHHVPVTSQNHDSHQNTESKVHFQPQENSLIVRKKRNYANGCLHCPIEIKTDSNINLALPLLALLLGNYLNSYQSLAASCTSTQTSTLFSTTTVTGATTLTSLTTTTVTVPSTQTSTSTQITTAMQTLTSNIFSSLTVFTTYFVTVTSVSSVTVTTISTVPANNCPKFKTLNFQETLESPFLEDNNQIADDIPTSWPRIQSSIKSPPRS